MKVLLLGARRYSFTSRDTGELIAGVRVSYLEPIGDYEDADASGNPAMEVAAPMSLWPSLVKLPAVCDVDFSRRPGRAGKPETTLVGVKVLAPVSMESLLKSTA